MSSQVAQFRTGAHLRKRAKINKISKSINLVLQIKSSILIRQPKKFFLMRSGNHSQLYHQIQIRWV